MIQFFYSKKRTTFFRLHFLDYTGILFTRTTTQLNTNFSPFYSDIFQDHKSFFYSGTFLTLQPTSGFYTRLFFFYFHLVLLWHFSHFFTQRYFPSSHFFKQRKQERKYLRFKQLGKNSDSRIFLLRHFS